MPIIKTQDQLNAQRKPNNNTPRKSIPKDDTPRKNIPKDDTSRQNPKNAQGSSNLIWNRKYPSRNTSSHAPANTQRFNQQTPKSTKQTHQQSQHTTNAPTPRFTPPLNSTSTHRFTPRSNINPSTPADANDSITQPNASTELARKREWRHYGDINGRN